MSIVSGLFGMRSRALAVLLDRKFAVGDQDLCLAMLEDEGDGFRVEPDVERVENRARHRHAEVRLEEFRYVRRHHGHGVAQPYAAPLERRRQTNATFVRFEPGTPNLSVHDRSTIRVHRPRSAV